MKALNKPILEIMDILEAIVLENNAIVIRIVLNSGDEWLTRELIPIAPCQNCYSVTKAFTGTAIGLAQDKGYFKIDDPILPYIGTKIPKEMDPKMERVTIRHLLANLTGIKERVLRDDDKFNIGTDDWLTYCLTLPMDYEPGEQYMYSNSNYYLLSYLIHHVTGMSLVDFLSKHVFAPLKIHDYAWATCPYGVHQGGSALYIRTEDMAKLGKLYQQKGLWNGKQILSENWVSEATTNQAAHTGNTFGLGIAGIQENYFGFHGAYNQTVVVRKDIDLVLAAHAYNNDFNITSALDAALHTLKII